MIDWHCHLLPGIDDGPATMDEAVEMTKFLHKAGYRTVYCTPHMMKGTFEADNAEVLSALDSLQAELKSRQIELQLFPGREYYLDEFLPDYLKDPLPLGDTRFIMVEIPDYIPTQYIRETCFQIKTSGYIPMIAHPERCIHFKAPEKKAGRGIFNLKFRNSNSNQDSDYLSLLSYLQDIGCVFQANLGSFSGIYGETVRRIAIRLKQDEIYTHFGTDLHNLLENPTDMKDSSEIIGSCR